MDNTQLKEIFQEIYKKSIFYKNTRWSIFKAYEWFIKDYFINALYRIKHYTTVEKIGQYITDVLDNVAPDAVENFVNAIVENLDPSQLIQSSQELGDILQNFQK